MTTNLLDNNVIFVKGYFNNTMPILREHIEQISILRLDGDMYESTVDVLYHMYDKLSIGGYVIVDDWAANFGARFACLDFFKAHSIGINCLLVPVGKTRILSFSWLCWHRKDNYS